MQWTRLRRGAGILLNAARAYWDLAVAGWNVRRATQDVVSWLQPCSPTLVIIDTTRRVTSNARRTTRNLLARFWPHSRKRATKDSNKRRKAFNVRKGKLNLLSRFQPWSQRHRPSAKATSRTTTRDLLTKLWLHSQRWPVIALFNTRRPTHDCLTSFQSNTYQWRTTDTFWWLVSWFSFQQAH